ncbi:neither inactivation nor afterpotential protein G [Wyeomyia smithii]|uniref:neither inactivation nor afterpotential protein G n=1 Tax=Wyeomyia smithii TaxID=174621 RepID=UPI002467D0D9|nr:neither inactivation nor afterpotential protein G [Wyeomyia smithii]
MGLLKILIISLATLLVVLTTTLSVTWLILGYDHIPNKVATAKSLQNSSFDFIIVGAGTAGCVLANRLSAVANYSVLLIEAGNIFGAASIVPLLSTALQLTKFDWAFRTTPQKYSSRGLFQQQQFIPRGRGLGGSGQINYMLHFTGVKEDYDRWERLGAHDWSYERMKPYLDRFEGNLADKTNENNNNCHSEQQREEHFKSNPYPAFLTNISNRSVPKLCFRAAPAGQYSSQPPKLHVKTIDPKTNNLTSAFLRARSELGLEHNFNAAKYTIRDGIRWSTYHEYLRPAFDRTNLRILPDTVVQKIIFDNHRTAIAVSILNPNDGSSIEIRATKEIILSAGAIQSPQLLKLSGIGPTLELQRHGIPVIHYSPNVGQNYFDHLNLPLFVSINQTASVTVDKILNVGNIWNYLSKGSGVLSSTAVAGIGSPRGAKYGIILFGMGSVDEHALRHVSNMHQDAFRAHFPLYYNSSQEGFLFLSTCHQPKSRGAVYLRDRYADSHPFINPNYLKDKFDIECMGAAIRLAARTIETSPFRRLNATLHWPKVTACANFGPTEEDFRTNRPDDRYLECILRTSALTGHHPGGTAAIGLHSEAVVGNDLKVRGVKNLRVADASVFPAPVSGTPNSVVVAVAEKAADVILSEYSNR